MDRVRLKRYGLAGLLFVSAGLGAAFWYASTRPKFPPIGYVTLDHAKPGAASATEIEVRDTDLYAVELQYTFDPDNATARQRTAGIAERPARTAEGKLEVPRPIVSLEYAIERKEGPHYMVVRTERVIVTDQKITSHTRGSIDKELVAFLLSPGVYRITSRLVQPIPWQPDPGLRLRIRKAYRGK